jgi:hypothetical protein
MEAGAMKRERLIANAAAAWAELEAKGFERICTVVAGLDSGSTWMHGKTGQIARVMVRNVNQIEYEAPRMMRLSEIDR